MQYFSVLRKCLLLLHVLLVSGVCAADHQSTTDAPVELRVMTFNIEYGGAHVSFDKVVEAIRLSKSDLVGIQEAEGNLQRLADRLGWHADLHNYAISKYPLIDPPGANGQYIYVEVSPGKIVALANVHLPSDPHGPYALRDGASLEQVLELERLTRLPFITPYLAILPKLVEQAIPVFITGDFNTPSHTDWTLQMVGSRKFLNQSVEWPVSRAVSVAGFVDSWHQMHPDPLKEPGLTWWAGRPPLEMYAPDENDPQDRIDFIWYAGPSTLLSSELVGEENAADVTISVMPWPSDHRAVVSGFSVIPADLPDVVTSKKRVYTLGEDIDIRYQWTDGEHAFISVDKINGDALLLQQSVNGSGHITLAAKDITAGQYRITLGPTDQQTSLIRDVWVLDPAEQPKVEVTGDAFAPGEIIPIRWSNAPGNRNDYVAIVSKEVVTELQTELPWAYISALPHGELRLDPLYSGTNKVLSKGTYVIHLLKDDGFEVLAESATFEIR